MQEAGFFSNVELTSFLNRVSFTKQCYYYIEACGKCITFQFFTNSEKSSVLFYSSPTEIDLILRMS